MSFPKSHLSQQTHQKPQIREFRGLSISGFHVLSSPMCLEKITRSVFFTMKKCFSVQDFHSSD